MKNISSIYKKVVKLRNLLFIYHNINYNDVAYAVGDTYVNYMVLQENTDIKLEDYSLFSVFVDIEKKFEENHELAKSDFTVLNEIYEIIKKDSRVNEFIKKNYATQN